MRSLKTNETKLNTLTKILDDGVNELNRQVDEENKKLTKPKGTKRQLEDPVEPPNKVPKIIDDLDTTTERKEALTHLIKTVNQVCTYTNSMNNSYVHTPSWPNKTAGHAPNGDHSGDEEDEEEEAEEEAEAAPPTKKENKKEQTKE